MGVPGSADLMVLATAAQAGGTGYPIEQSLRFDGSSYLTHTHGSTPTGDNGTLSVWVKRRGANYDYDTIIEGAPSNGRGAHYLRNVTSGNDGRIDMHQFFPDNGGIDGGQVPDAQLRDPSAWYHLLWQHQNTGTRTLGDRLWINGVLQTNLTYPGVYNAQPWAVTRNGNTATIGRYFFTYGYLHGYLAEMHCIDGSLVAVDQFGEYDDNGVWRPIEYTGSYGNNGFYLKFDPSATNGIGHDHSGNGNHFTASGFSTSSATYNINNDVVNDTPTNNHATWLPGKDGLIPAEAQAVAATRGNGNLYGNTGRNSPQALQASIPFPDNAKTYAEVYFNDSNGGVAISLTFDNGFGPYVYGSGNYNLDYAVSWSGYTGAVENPGSVWTGSSSGGTFSVGDLIGVSVDTTGSTASVVFYKNGTQVASGTVAASAKSTLLLNVAPSTGSSTYVGAYLNAGQYPFDNLPSGFNALCTASLPAPDIADGSDYFRTVTYSGTGSTRDITVADNAGNAWQPDLVWIKNRDVTDHHALFDSVRGVLNWIATNRTNAETAIANSLTSFNSDGFTLGSANLTNYLNQAYVSWNWRAGGSSSSNTGGSITSTVSANPSAGFSVVTYTGNNSSSATVGHGLGVNPAMIILKARAGTNASNHWYCWHQKLTSGYNILPSSTSGELIASSGVIAAPTNGTNFGFTTSGNLLNVNENNTTYVAYCFAEIEGYNKFGIYTGNGSTDGPFVYTGHRSAWLLVKCSSTSGEPWFVLDTTRSPYNVSLAYLVPSSDQAEVSDANTLQIDLLSNGFKLRSSGGNVNGSGRSYIFVSVAENPFGGDGVSPATAR